MAAPVFPFDQPVVWTPTPAQIRRSNLHRFGQRHGAPDLAALERRAAREPAWFWAAVLEDLGIEFERPYTQVLDLTPGLRRPRWCVDGRMNIVHNCLDKWQRGDQFDPRARTALVGEAEDGTVQRLTYAELHARVGQGANALRAGGVEAGDVIGICLPLNPEAVIAFLAIVKVGGIALPLFSGFGAAAMQSRLRDGAAKGLIIAAGFTRGGRWRPLFPRVAAMLAQVPSLACVWIAGVARPPRAPIRRGLALRAWDVCCRQERTEAATASVDADAPCLLIYTSGTTGQPKGIVHAHCGFPVKAAQDMAHGFDVKRDDLVAWYTDLGWMMGPWLILGTLLLGSAMAVYDGAPAFPDPGRLWALCARHAVSLFGLSPTVARLLQGHGPEWVARHDLTRLRAIGATGSPWDPAAWTWIFRHALAGAKPLLNYTGGTEISGGILGCHWLRPLKPCAFNASLPGMDADVVDAQGDSLVGIAGELVVRQPWIGMARGFWRDDGRRYEDTYWSAWPHLWRQGDLAVRDVEGYWFVLGRSDDTMNVADKRVGPAEYEQILNGHPAVAESAAVAMPDPVKGQQAVCFCVLHADVKADAALRARLLAAVVHQLGKPLRPADLIFVPALPKTRNSKIMRRLIRDVYLQRPTGDASSLEDETALAGLAQAIDAARRPARGA